jgi:2-desacetyl-2-hydroxyethyl bacteriochlorophyllide A dehydrogenase
MKRLALFFESPGRVALHEEELPPTPANSLLVQSLQSAISPGTELLIYRGEFPDDLALDQNIASLAGAFHYPCKYGYATVGKVIQAGEGLEAGWLGQIVFAFHPHENFFHASPGELIPLPQDLPPEEALFLPNMETAVNFVMDGRPLIGENVLVFGQGIVGILTTLLLAQHPLKSLVTLDRYSFRRRLSQSSGAHACLDPGMDQWEPELRKLQPEGADLTFELSGAPAALDQAIAATGYAGRLVIGSWYGKKRVNLDLGGRFHRSRIRLLSSQVSTIAPELSARWTKSRRFALAWDMIEKLKPSHLITHRFSFDEANQAYALLDREPGQALQVVFDYPA